jgi:hypothetical protein
MDVPLSGPGTEAHCSHFLPKREKGMYNVKEIVKDTILL